MNLVDQISISSKAKERQDATFNYFWTLGVILDYAMVKFIGRSLDTFILES